MSISSATPPATRRIARSYLTDLVAAIPVPPGESGRQAHGLIAPVVEQLLERAVKVRHVLKNDELVLTFDLADDPASWSTRPAAQQGTAAGLDDPPTSAADSEAHTVPAADLGQAPVENRDYPGQPGERA
ncbi:MAG TPA: hypothetical protein VIQ30_00210 [Pseudonocardia sp.]